MAGITPIPTTRVGSYFIRQRLVNQVQTDQLDLFRLQTQVSTGLRIFRPSDDAPAALRAIALQRTISRKVQSERNLAGSRSVLAVADTALDSVGGILRDVRAAGLEVTSNLTSAESRQAAVAQIDAAISSLLTTGNSNYNGRYLFAGSRTNVAPFSKSGEFVSFIGNEKSLQNYVDLEQLFTTNLPGTEVLGGISGEVRGTADVNPQLTQNTLLTSINGGDGIATNSALTVSVTNGPSTTSSIVDLSGSVTIGDVIRRIEANPPAGGSIRVDIVNNGLRVTALNPGTTVRISEVSNGRAAKELGIFSTTSLPVQSGADLNPVVGKTTLLTDLLGVKSSGRLASTNANNDLAITASVNGPAFDGVTVQYVSDVAAGNEYADYSAGVLTVHIQDGESTANQVISAINAEGTFTAKLDERDTTTVALAGTGKVNIQTFTNVTSGGSGEPLDTASGLILTNGGESVSLDVSGAKTVEDLFNLISTAGVGLVAEINAERNGINVRSQLSGADFTIGENGGTTATQLGIRSYNASTQLADFNRGVGVITNDTVDSSWTPLTSDLVITARNGTVLTVPAVDLTGATSLTEVASLINGLPNNHDGATIVSAGLTPDGKGLRLVDSSTTTLSDLSVLGNATSEALGFVAPGGASAIDGSPDVNGDLTLNSYRHTLEDDFVIVARDGAELWIDATGATTVQDVIDRVNNHVKNNNGTTSIEARLAATGNGIELIDTSTAATGDLTVRAAEGSEVAQLLGFVPQGQTEATSNTGSGGGDYSLTSEDRNTFEVDSAFNSLIRLRSAIQAGDAAAIGEAIERLDVDLDRVTFARGEIGTRLQTLDAVQVRLEDENVQLQSALSNEIDVDLVEAISNLTARQYALQASLQTAGLILNLSILDYI